MSLLIQFITSNILWEKFQNETLAQTSNVQNIMILQLKDSQDADFLSVVSRRVCTQMKYGF